MVTLVAGVDSSTQSCKVVICDADSGQVIREGHAPHPDGTEVHPDAWWTALQSAIAAAGGLQDVTAVSVAGQQHGMVCLDDDGLVVRPALLWNDTRSAQAAKDLVAELDGGAAAWATAVGSVPVASFTVTKLRWLAEHEPEAASRTAAVCLPHDWLTWKLAATSSLDTLVSDRSDASGTGYWSPAQETYRDDLLRMAMGRVVELPRIAGPAEVAAETSTGQLLGAGAGDNAGAALGLSARAGDVVVSLGTSGVASAISTRPSADPSGLVAGFADATGLFLPLACTLNAARVLDAAARILDVSLDRLSDLALSAPAGADGVTLVPYLEGERTPNKPQATGALHGLQSGNSTPAHLARSYVEGMLCGLADGIDALVEQGVEVRRILLIGGAAQSPAVRRIAPTIFGRPVVVPPTGEYVARGAARQAAWVASGHTTPPEWSTDGTQEFGADVVPAIRSRYAEVKEMTTTVDRARTQPG